MGFKAQGEEGKQKKQKNISQKVCRFKYKALPLQQETKIDLPPKPGLRIDRDTHQITTENRERFVFQWRATPRLEVALCRWITKIGEHSNLIILGVSSHLLPAF